MLVTLTLSFCLHLNPSGCLEGAKAAEQKGQLDEAVRQYRNCIAQAPEHWSSYAWLAAAFKRMGRGEEQAAVAWQGLQFNPNMEYGSSLAHYWFAENLTLAGKLREAAPHYTQYFYLTRLLGADEPMDEKYGLSGRTSLNFVSVEKLKHDIEQFQYLIDERKLDADTAEFVKEEKEKYEEYIPLMPDPETISTFLDDSQRPLSFGRAVHMEDLPSLEGPAVNPGLETARIEAEYRSSGTGKEMVYFDDFLTNEALQQLRRFCLGSTMWYDVNQNGKHGAYVGAYLDAGFLPDVVVSIGEELSTKLPNIFQKHVLKGVWAYKYASNSDPEADASGIAIHADPAAVNVNFWITDDEANLDPTSGGLVVYKTGAPPDQVAFDDFNNCGEICRQRLDQIGYSNMTVPYRSNRIVIFNSNLYHKTDRFQFKPGYKKRRINITFLFGFRNEAAVGSKKQSAK